MKSATKKKKNKSEVKRVMFAGAHVPSKSDTSRGWNGRFLRAMGLRTPLISLKTLAALAFVLLFAYGIYSSGGRGTRYSPRDLFPYRSCDIITFEVSGKTSLEPRQACAVESIAFHHSNRTVCLGMRAPLPLLKAAKRQFANITNLFVVPIDLDTIFRWTPIQDWWAEEFKYQRQDAPWRTIHLADALRLAYLWKYGGLYLDLDFLVLQPFEDREDNFVGAQHTSVSDGVNTAAMKFERGHPFLTNWIYEVPAKYREDDRSCIGPSLVTPMLMHYCQGDVPMTSLKLEELLGKYCDYDLHVFGPKTFYPVAWPDWKAIFKVRRENPPELIYRILDDKDVFALHLWNELSSRLTEAEVDDASVFSALARDNCPNTFRGEFQKKAVSSDDGVKS